MSSGLLGRSGGKGGRLLLLRLLLLLLLLLMLELMLELRRDRGHRRRSGLERLLDRRLAEAGILLRERRGGLLRLQTRVARELLLEGSLAESRRLRSEWTRLLLLLLLASRAGERASILLLTWALAVGPQVGVGVRIHGCDGERLNCSVPS